MSDWGGTNSIIESVEAGCDLEMPVSGKKWQGQKLLSAVKKGDMRRDAIEKAAANILYQVERTKGSFLLAGAVEKGANREETPELSRKAGLQGLILLKNEGSVLLIKPSRKKIAVIGPNANRAIAGGGGGQTLIPTTILFPWTV